MKAKDVKVEFVVNGKRVTDVVRINHLRKLVFADGSHELVHQFHDFADVAASLSRMDAGNVRSRHQIAPSKVRASDKTWRGERDGKRTDHRLSIIGAYDLTRDGITRYPR